MVWEHYYDKDFIVREGDVVTATDPCYDAPEGVHFNLPVGVYECMYDITDEGLWGRRVAKCAILREGSHLYEPDEAYRIFEGSTGVDAGLAGFFINKPDYDDPAWEQFCHEVYANEDEGAYHTPEGFFTQSGYGDGEYDVYILKNRDEVVGAMIIFIEEPEYDDEDEDDWEDEEDE